MMEGSLRTIPRPRTKTRVFAVPRSIARSEENSPHMRSASIARTTSKSRATGELRANAAIRKPTRCPSRRTGDPPMTATDARPTAAREFDCVWRRWRPLHLAPVGAFGRENRRAAGRGRRTVKRVGGGAPHRVVGRRAMGLERRLVLVDLVEVVGVLVLRVLQHVEPETAGFVALGAQRVDLDRFEEPLLLVRFHAYLHPDRDHWSPPCSATRMVARSRRQRRAKAPRKNARVGSTRRAQGDR